MTTNTTHTHGPWEITVDTSALEICTLYGLTRRPTEDGLGQNFIAIRKAGERFHIATDEEQDANASLIAAAPELLQVAREAAEESCSTKGNEDMEAGCCRSCCARATVAKATGKAS